VEAVAIRSDSEFQKYPDGLRAYSLKGVGQRGKSDHLSAPGHSFLGSPFFKQPRLTEHLQSPDAAIAENAPICLRNYGATASDALPFLTKALAHPNERVRTEAAKAIQRITALSRE